MRTMLLTIAGLTLLAANSGCQTGPSGVRAGKAPSPPVFEKTLTFDGAPLGKTPGDFTAAATGPGPASSWLVGDDGGRVLTQTSADAVNKQRFPVCVYEPLSLRDVEATVRFKPLTGVIDQSGGIIIRYQDKDNYYVLRANALEDNVRLYKLEKGKRSLIAGIVTRVTPRHWHTLTIRAKGNHFDAAFDDKTFEGGDSTFTTPGRVGLWTKADSVTEFSPIHVKSYDSPTTAPAGKRTED